ncbi:MAG TPA: class I SAM-dependent methyltransferase [Candidatus Nanoarchaeia archaeon]|nr:class I SAM-dependent methyltransferase [Candidatus Nanoarchaeia archaeon]
MILKSWLKRYLDSINFKSKKVLDVGCGKGKYSTLFNGGYIGIDKDTKKIKLAKSKYNASKFEVMDATKLRFKNNSFNLVFSIAVFHHLNDNEIIKAFKEIYRVTAKGGNILLVDLVLPKSIKFLAYPVFWFDKGAYIREFNRLSEMLSNEVNPRFTSLSRFLNLGVAVMEWKK